MDALRGRFPNGFYKIDPGAAEGIFDPGEIHLVDGFRQAGTVAGRYGRQRCHLSGNGMAGTPFYDTDETHIVSLP